MKEFSIGLVRVLTRPWEYFAGMDGFLEKLWPGVGFQSEILEGQPSGVHDAATFASAGPKVVRACQVLQERGMDAVIVNCAMDPGVDEAVELCRVPVYGAGSSAACLARATSRPVGVLGLVGEIPACMERILSGRIIASTCPERVENVLDLWSEKGKAATVEAAGKLVSAGAGVIVLACTGMTPMGVAQELRQTTGLPVFDPMFSAVALAVLLLRGELERKTEALRISSGFTVEGA